ARAAKTYSLWTTAITAPRIKRIVMGQVNMVSTKATSKIPRDSKTLRNTIAPKKYGIAKTISAAREMSVSTQPPKYPATKPRTIETNTDRAATTTPTAIDARAP